ncbi:MAG: riboflavin synthase, partial [Actinobacteria bacterium]|nr:riboflavin synthase [Actinomycetota bacterium]
MFTGMIKEVGKLNKTSRINTGLEIEAGSLLLTKNMKNGDSIAVNGCCLTVSSFIAGKSFKADVSFSTL